MWGGFALWTHAVRQERLLLLAENCSKLLKKTHCSYWKVFFWILPSLFFLWHNCCLQRYVRRRSFYKYSGDNGGASLTIQPSLSLISNHFSVLMLNLLYKWSLSGRHISWSKILQIYRIQPSDQISAKSWAIIENIRQGSIALKLAIFHWIQYPYLRFAF